MQAKERLYQRADQVLVLYADMPLLRTETLKGLTQLRAGSAHRQHPPAALSLLTVERKDAQGFGRIVRGQNGSVRAIVEEADCTPEQLAIRELNPGVYCFNAQWLWENISLLTPSASGELYLTDLLAIAVEQDQNVETVAAAPDETLGINDRSQLAVAARALRRRINTDHMLAGVTIVDPASTYIDADVTIGQDSTILPGTHLQGGHHRRRRLLHRTQQPHRRQRNRRCLPRRVQRHRTGQNGPGQRSRPPSAICGRAPISAKTCIWETSAK